MDITIILFIIYAWGLGYTLSYFVKKSENWLERHIMNLGFGLALFIVLAVFLNLLRIPIDWRIFFIASLIFPVSKLFINLKNKKIRLPNLKLKLKKSHISAVFALIIFFFCLNMYSGGAFTYPYLENDDSWRHAVSVKYISTEKTLDEPEGIWFPYLDPYPPGYGVLLSVLDQTSESISWVLKFFNGLIISLGILFFYFFAKEFTGNRNKALFATFILAAVPSYFTHFIWAHTLVVMFFFPALYCLERIKKDKNWSYIAMVVIAAMLLTQPSQSIKLGIMFGIYWAVKAIIEKDILKDVIFAGLGGLVISLMWWMSRFKEMFLQETGISNLADPAAPLSLFQKIQEIFPADKGTATKAYSFTDFFIAKPFGGINVHIGWGVFVTILIAIGIIGTIIYFSLKRKEIFKKENSWIFITLTWFVFTFLGTNSMTFNLPVGFIAFRFWILLAIPASLLCSIGAWYLFKLGKKFSIPAVLILAVLLTGVFFTSASQKYNQNHEAMWPPGVFWTSNEELSGFLWLKSLPPDTKVFGLCSDESSNHIIGFDKLDKPWEKDIIEFKAGVLNETPEKVHTFLKGKNYEYFVIDSKCIKNHGINKTNNFITSFAGSSQFSISHQTQGMIAVKIK